MNHRDGNTDKLIHGHQHHRRGPSSFWMHDPEVIFSEIGLERGEALLDLGCGPGDYAIYAAKVIGGQGAVYAVDRGQEMIGKLITDADDQGIENIFGIVADITAPVPMADRCIDICFISTVLHVPDITKAIKPLLGEVRRVLKPSGRLAIIECKKQAAPFGPPLQLRLSPEEIEASVTPNGFEKTGYTDLGYNYLIQFRSVA